MKKKEKINNIIAVLIMALLVCFVYVSFTTFVKIVPKQVVTSAAGIKTELNRQYNDLNRFSFVHASDNLIILNDANYVVMLEKSENIWGVTALVNPYYGLINIQSSYYTSIDIDTTLRYLIFTTPDPQGAPKTYHSAYIFDIEKHKISKYPHAELPKDIVPFYPENRDTSPDGKWSFNKHNNDEHITLHNNLTEKTKKPILLGDLQGRPVFYSNSELLYLLKGELANKNASASLLKDYLIMMYNIETGKFASIDIKY